MAEVVLIEPFYGGSHQAWADGWMRHSRHDITLISHPDEFWRWRLRGGAVTLAELFDAQVKQAGRPDVVVVSGMVDVAAFTGIARRSLGDTPVAIYVHESQVLYPKAPKQGVDSSSELVNWKSLVAADAVWFNSAFHQDALRGALPALLRSQPTPSHDHLFDSVFEKSRVLWPPVEIDALLRGGRVRNPVPRVLWNQRWDHDKNPRAVFKALARLAEDDVPFTLSLAGQNLRPKDPELAWVHKRLRDRIDHSGFLPPDEYAALLLRSDVVVSAAAHEFFGIAVVEAIAAGAVPVLPSRLSFPELIHARWHHEALYPEGALQSRLNHVLENLDEVRRELGGLRESMAQFGADRSAQAHDKAVDRLLGDAALD